MMGILGRVFNGTSEKHILDRGKEVVNHAVAANKILIKLVTDRSGSVNEVRKMEELSDREVFEISNAITSGAIAPNIIDDMIMFIDTEDSIVDNILNLSRAIDRYTPKDKETRDYVKENILKLCDLTNSALALLYEMHKASTIIEATKIRMNIEALEHQGDDIKDAMLKYTYDSDNLNFKDFYYIQSAAYLSDDILDACEDASDMILSIMRSIVT